MKKKTKKSVTDRLKEGKRAAVYSPPMSQAGGRKIESQA